MFDKIMFDIHVVAQLGELGGIIWILVWLGEIRGQHRLMWKWFQNKVMAEVNGYDKHKKAKAATTE